MASLAEKSPRPAHSDHPVSSQQQPHGANQPHNQEQSQGANPLYLDQQYPGQQYPGQHNPEQQYPGQQYPGQHYPGQQHQVVYIQSLPTHPQRYENYNGKLSIIFGTCLIGMATIALLLNVAGFVIQINRDYDWIGNFLYFVFPSAWSGVFVYMAASFAIAAGKSRSRCLIIAHMVLAIIGSVFAFASVGVTAGAVGYDGVDGRMGNAAKKSLVISVVWLMLSVAIFVLITWCSVLCCKVMCCGQTTIPVGVAMAMPGPSNQQGTGLGPSGGVVAYHVRPEEPISQPPPYAEK